MEFEDFPPRDGTTLSQWSGMCVFFSGSILFLRNIPIQRIDPIGEVAEAGNGFIYELRCGRDLQLLKSEVILFCLQTTRNT